MPEPALEPEALTGVLTFMLRNRPDAVLAGLAGDGSICALPDAEELAGHPALPVPLRRSNMMSLVVPDDRLVVLSTWERCQATGVGRNEVRLLESPDALTDVVFVDTRHLYGVRLAALFPAERTSGTTRFEHPAAHRSVALLDASGPRTASLVKSHAAIISSVDERVSLMLGWEPDEMVGQRSLVFLHPDDHERVISNWLELINTGGTSRVRARHRTKHEHWLWIETEHTFRPGPDPDDFEGGDVLAVLTDISDEMAAHDAIDRREKLFRRLAESLPIGLFQVQTDHSVVYANGRLADILGVLHAGTLEEQLSTVAELDRAGVDAAFAAVLTEGIDQELEVAVRLPDPGRRALGDTRRCAFVLTALSDQEGAPGAIVTVSDVTEAARMREELTARATYDALTGVHNRASTMVALEQALARREHQALAVIFVDLDDFKPVNDRCGHAVGDELLARVARRMHALLRGDDLLGRIGGDEFLLICPLGPRDRPDGAAPSGPPTVTEQALAIGQRVWDCLHGRIEIGGDVLELRASVGIAVCEPHLDADALVARADAAMYAAKRSADEGPVLFTPELCA